MSKTIDQIPQHDRPREKLLAKGAAALKDHKLLAILLAKGTTKMDVMTLAENLRRVVDEKRLELQVEDIEHLEGMGQIKAMTIVAAIEFARRRIKPEGVKITTPADVLPQIRHYADRKQEHFICATVNGANELINIRVISIGLIDRSPVHPREVFADAVADRASGVIVAHNHPAGSLKPSENDTEATHRLKAAGEIVGIEVLDHIIFNRVEYFSFLEAGLL
jgi:DNA repair protein RadC